MLNQSADYRISQLESRVKTLEAAVVKLGQPELNVNFKVEKNRFVWPVSTPSSYSIGDVFRGKGVASEEYVLAQVEGDVVNLIGLECGNRHGNSLQLSVDTDVFQIPSEVFHKHFTGCNPNAKSFDDRLPFERVRQRTKR